MQKLEDDDDDIVCLDDSFFINRNYELTTFTFGTHVLNLLCLRAASTDYDLTGQLVWPGAMLMNNYLSKNANILEGRTVIELGSGVGITGLIAEKLEWGNTDQISEILQKYQKGFDLILGADICFQQSSIPHLFNTVAKLLHFRGGNCKFILAYVSRAKMMDEMVISEASQHGMQVDEVCGTRSIISNLEGVIYQITLN